MTDYKVEYSSNGGTTWTTFADGVSTATTATVTGLTDGTTYTFRVSAVNSVGTGATSTVATATPGTPGAPTSLAVTPSSGAVVVSWAAPATNPAAVASYQYQYRTYGTGSWSAWATATSPLTISGLTDGSAYDVAVRALTAASTPGASATASAFSGGGVALWLDADQASSITLSGGSVQTWADRSGNGRDVSAPSSSLRPSSTSQTLNSRPVITFNGTTVLEDLSGSTNRYSITGDRTMVLVARYRTAPSYFIDRAAVTNNLFGIDGTVTGTGKLQVRDDTNGQYQNLGTITPASNTGFITTSIRSGSALSHYVSGALSATGTLTGTVTQPAIAVGRHVSTTTTADADIAEIILYNRALSTAEQRNLEQYLAGKWGVSVTPGLVSSINTTASNNQIALSWTAPNTGGAVITNYSVQYSTSSAMTSPTTISTISGTSTTITGLTNGTTYYFQVRATNSVGTGPWGPVTPTSATIMPLDAISTTPRAAYSTRQLLNAYKGPLLQVRRSSDNTTLDIGATTSGALDTASMLSFVGSGNGFVTTWYDQSGNGYDLTQSTTSRQPQIVTAGSIIGVNGLGVPALQGSNSAQRNLTGSVGSVSTTPLSMYGVVNITNVSTTNTRVWSVGVGTTSSDYNATTLFNVNKRGGGSTVAIERSSVGTGFTATANAAMPLAAVFSGTTQQLFYNSSSSTASSDTRAFAFNTLRVLQSINPSFEATEALDANLGETIMFTAALSSADRTTLMNNEAAWYGTNAPTIGNVNAGNASATVNWTNPSVTGTTITDYAVSAYTDAAGTVAAVPGSTMKSAASCSGSAATRQVGSASATSYVFPCLNAGQTYYFRVAALSAAGTGPQSGVSAGATAQSMPGAPIMVPGDDVRVVAPSRQPDEPLVPVLAWITWALFELVGACGAIARTHRRTVPSTTTIWRREWDSNPRGSSPNGFQDRPIRPLWHPSEF